MKIKITLLIFILIFPLVVFTQGNLQFGERYAIILGGIGGQKEFTQKYFQQTQRMYHLLVKNLSYNPDNIYYLFEDPDLDPEKIQYQITAENIRGVFGELSRRMKAEDQLFVFMVGHGTYDGEWSKFNIVGPDLRDLDFAQLIETLPSQKIVLVNTASASGPFIQKLSGKNRVIITATKSGREYYETTFADFFLEALTTEEADVNKDKRISVLEAFNYARSRQKAWYDENRQLKAEHPLLDDNGDGKGSQEIDMKTEGLWANRVYLGPLSPEMATTLKRVHLGTSSRMDSLRFEVYRLEQQIEDLKARKNQMRSEVYFRQLETLLVRLAKVNKELKQLEAQERKQR